MFTNRFIEVPIELIDKKQAEIMGDNKADEIPAIAKINPFEITYYRETTDDDNNVSATMIHFKNSDTLYIPLNIQEFEKILNKHAI